MEIEVSTNLPEVENGRVRLLRRAEYDKLVDAGVFRGEKVELIRGVIVRMPPQGAPHAGPIELLTEILVTALAGRARVRVQLPLIAPDESEPEPDFAVVAKADPHAQHPSSAHLIIEVANTTGAYDRGTKAPLYAEMGVPEYWIVDVPARAIEVRRDPRGESYARIETFRAGSEIALLAFPDVRVAVTSVFG